MTCRVLTLQSWVTHGFVGNKCSVFALQLLGFDADAINTVNFSNHTGYPSWTGEVLTGQQLATIFQGLEKNGLLKGITHLLTGYVRSASCLQEISKIHDRLKELNPDLIYVCDPVMGDEGKLYVPEENVAFFKSLVPKADILLPNQTEAELLTNVSIVNQLTAFQCIDVLHEQGASLVIITSSHFDSSTDQLSLYGSWRPRDNSSAAERFRLSFDRLEGQFTGTGDLFSALTLAWMWRFSNDLPQRAPATLPTPCDGLATSVAARACEVALCSLQAVLGRTIEASKNRAADQLPKTPELQLIQSAADLLQPKVTMFAEKVDLK